ncbi:MAG: shikimate kinase [Flavobacteriaceae bacterium]|nr:shikimate kinase [Flavobacteriaceae bacterium]MDZ4147674.1 shikimate kinase [Flavobacteriaceae bacterium]
MSLYSAENQKIVLLGYMGSGKSAIGKSLAELSSLPYIDLDDFMVESENMSIDQIFSQKGEIYFRKKEHQYLLELLNFPGQKIIALGGGTPCYHDNISLLKTEGIVSIYLKTSIETLANRLKSETEKRPILKRFSAPEGLTEFIAKHLFERQYYYSQADFIIQTDYKEAVEIAQEIATLLKRNKTT